jgi:DNA-binding HxlR family transcriptional regulator
MDSVQKNMDSDIIRTEILRVLNESGKIRGSDLTSRVIKRVGNEKMVHREISSLVESGEVEKKMYSKSHIEYQIINISETVNNQLKGVHKEIEVIFEDIKEFRAIIEQNKLEFQERLRTTIHLIHIVQSIDGVMKLLAHYPTFKKDRMFSQITRKISDCWEGLMEIIVHQPEEEFLNEVIGNLRISQIGTESVN